MSTSSSIVLSSRGPPSMKDESATIASQSRFPKTVDIELKLLQGRNFIHSHNSILKQYKPSYSVEVVCGPAKERSAMSQKGDLAPKWDTTFIFAAGVSTTLTLRVHCREGHLVGETTLDLLKLSRNEDVIVEIRGPSKTSMQNVNGHLVLRLKVSWSIRFSDTMPHVNLDGMKYLEIINSLSTEQLKTLSHTWKRFLSSFSGVIVQAKYIAQVNSISIVAAAAVAFAVQIIVDQSTRDDKVERLVHIMADLYTYFNDAEQIKQIMTYKRTLARLLNQTSETAHFIADYRKITSFAQRAMVHMVSDADEMISGFERAFGELKIELIMGSSLQTAIVSFRILQKVQNIESLLYISLLPYLKRATWDTSRCCLRGTREGIITDIVHWASNFDARQQSRLYLLTGPTGSGKSSIAHTVAGIFDKVKRLGAAVFTHDCTDQRVDAQAICSTIAFQLADFDDMIKQRTAGLMARNAHLASADITRQFPNLIVPAVRGLSLIGPILIVIDGLSDAAEQAKLIKVLTDHSSGLPVNFRILLTSRPQRLTPGTLAKFHRVRVIDYDDGEEGNLNIQDYISRAVERLFDTKPSLRKHFVIAELQNQLVQRAFGLHFWAATMYRWLSSFSDAFAELFLQTILADEIPVTTEGAMNTLYHAVLQAMPDRISAYRIFEALVKPWAVPRFIAEGDIDQEYPGLIIKIEDAHPKKTSNSFRLHPSFEDFLTDPERCGRKFVVHRFHPIGISLWEPCLDQLISSLKHNICDLSDPLALNDEIPQREERIQNFISGSLQYACQNWVNHLELAARYLSPSEVQVAIRKIHDILFCHLLHWIEVMSLLGNSNLVLQSLRNLAWWLKRHGIAANDELFVIVREGILFSGSFFSLFTKAAMQTYISALILMPSDSLLFRTYKEKPHGLLNMATDLESGFTIVDEPSQKPMPRDAKYSAFASFRYLLACAETSPNQRICFYDSRTGHKVGLSLPLTNVSSMDFSYNGQHIAVAGTGNFGIWDIKSGTQIRIIDAAPNWPSGVILSSNGSLILGIVNTGASSFEVLAWDVKTGDRLLGVKLECYRHLHFRVPIALSSDGRTLAGPSRQDGDGVQFLDIQTAAPPLVHPSDPRSNSTPSGLTRFKAAFWSPDSSLLATLTSSDNRVHIWSINNEQTTVESELEGTCPGVKWLSFSPDNSCIAGLYQDTWLKKNGKCEAAVWDTYSGKRMWSKDLQFEPGWVHEWRHCISFLPDGHEIFFYTGLHSRPVRVVRLPGHMAYLPSCYEDLPTTTIQYTQLTLALPPTFANQVDEEGWIRDLAGKRHLWVPYRNFRIQTKEREESDDTAELTLQKTTLELTDPQSKRVVMKIKIDFALEPTRANELHFIQQEASTRNHN